MSPVERWNDEANDRRHVLALTCSGSALPQWGVLRSHGLD